MAALIDTHLHLGRAEFDDDREAVQLRSQAAGVGAFIHVGFDGESIDHALALAQQDDSSWATAGIHPHDAASYDDAAEERLRSLANSGSIVAIGECGLDFFRDLSPRDVQEAAFRRQIALATEVALPMVFHVRDAYDDARRVLEDAGLPPRRGVFHAFAGDGEFARWAVDNGFRLGIGGPLTYKNSKLPQAIAGLPAESFVLETDAPWLPPQPWRGKRNEPAYVRETARVLAELLDVDIDALSDSLARTVEAVFAIKLPPEVWDVRPSTCPVPPRR